MPDNVIVTSPIRRYYRRKRRITVNVSVVAGTITVELAEKINGVYTPVDSRTASSGNFTLNASRNSQRDWRVTVSGSGNCNYSVSTSA